MAASGITAIHVFFDTSGDVLQEATTGNTTATYALTASDIESASFGGTTTVNVPLTFLTGSPQLAADFGSTLAVGGAISTAAVLTVSSNNNGTVILSGNNAFSAGISVNPGMLTAASNTALGNGNVHLMAGASLTLNVGVILTNQRAATLTLDDPATSRVDLLGSSIQDTVAALVVNGVNEPAGTYGAAGSGASDTGLADFLGTGELLWCPSRPPGGWCSWEVSCSVYAYYATPPSILTVLLVAAGIARARI